MKKENGRGSNGKKNTVVDIKSLGPVDDLEKYVKSDWWKRLFNSNYLKTDGDVVEDSQITSTEIELFKEILKLNSGQCILDLCCGQGRHSIELAKQGFNNINGLDRSHYLIQRAKGIARKGSLNIRFREGDARKLPYSPDSFDVVLIPGNSFGYFESKQDDLFVLKEVRRTLKPGGKLLIDVTDGEYMKNNYQPRSWEWIDNKYFVCRERSLSSDKDRLVSREVISHVDKGIIADQFYAERLYTRENIKSLLEEAGFTEIIIHTEINPDSQRNQDLGMMAQRLIITAQIVKDWAPINDIKKDMKNVVVIMGDPLKRDFVKPNNGFDDDDLYTIEQLKKGLKDLKNYRFIYVNNHNLLVSDLLKLKGKVDLVFNLCDEGFCNDPSKELHIPSLLEMLEMPYSGGGPQNIAYCYDKSLVRGIAKEMGIPVPDAFFIKPEDSVFDLPLDLPVIVKPNFGDGSFGITQKSVAYDVEQLNDSISQLRDKFGYEKPLLVEELLTGKDISLGIIGNPPDQYMVLPPIEEDYSELPEGLPRICGYEAKWLSDSPYWKIKSISANLDDQTEKFIEDCCLKLYERLGCRDYCRFDWRLDAKGNPFLLEVNPNPGWCWDGHFAKMAKIAHISYTEMLKSILQAAEQRLKISS